MGYKDAAIADIRCTGRGGGARAKQAVDEKKVGRLSVRYVRQGMILPTTRHDRPSERDEGRGLGKDRAYHYLDDADDAG